MIAQCGIVRVSRSRLRHNLELLRGRGGGARLCAVIKANAYGHGLDLVAEELREAGVEWGCVYTLEEALNLTESRMSILVLSPVVITPESGLVENLRAILQQNIRLNITDLDSALRLSVLADQLLPSGARLPIHIQVDTGLTRMGVSPEDVMELAKRVSTFPALKLEGLFAHFSHGDVAGHMTLTQQLQTLRDVSAPLKKVRPDLLIHAQNSGGVWHLGDAGLDMVRLGIALYGLQPSTAEPIAGLLPVACVTAPVLAVHDRPAGTGVGYGHTFVTRRPSRLAIVPVGYADGYPRQLSNRCVAQIRETDAPVVGRVSMDQIILDVTDMPGVTPGETVTVISWDPAKPNCLDKMADTIGTIGYELATHLGPRLKRVVVD
jgi:alanine racemase